VSITAISTTIITNKDKEEAVIYTINIAITTKTTTITILVEVIFFK